MIKPRKLKKGDTVAIVSLSSGLAGEESCRYRYEIGKERLEKEFGLVVKTMPNALKGIKYLDEHPEARAKDLMDAFLDSEIKAIFTNIGGIDTIRLLPYIDYDVIKNNPKIFIGYSDTTINHLMMYKAGLISFYGPSIMTCFAENVEMHDYTKKYVKEVLFGKEDVVIESSPYWTSEFLNWSNFENQKIKRKLNKEVHGYEVLQGSGKVSGKLLGGCIDVFPLAIGTEIWPTLDEWNEKILFIETSEDKIEPIVFMCYLRNLVAQGIIERINGIIVGKPQEEKYYDEYKESLLRVIGEEAKRPDLPILYNVNIGHASPICTLPYGVLVEVDLDNKKITLLEKAVID